MNDILSILKTVEAPDLTESNYGYNIQQQFENIDSNFQKLGNRDFIKGEKGADLGLEQIVLISDGLVLTELGAAVFNALLNTDKIEAGWLLSSDEFREEFNSDTLKPILDTNWYDYFVKDGKPDPETSTVSVFYRAVNPLLQNSSKEYIGSPIPLVFIDARFTSNIIQNIKSINNSYDIYLDVVDKSCALYIKYDNGWKVEKVNQFPTLYYEDSMFKWKLSNKKSGIRAQGIQGLDGKPGRAWIGLTEAEITKDVDLLNVNSAYVPIKYVMSFYNLTEENSNGEKSTWITPEEATETKHGGLSIGDTIIMIPKIDITNRLSDLNSISQNMLFEAASSNNQIWISIVQKNAKGQFITYFSNENLINVSVGNTWMRETMMRAGDDNFKVTKGLFLRLKPNDEDENELRAHLLYATGDTGAYTDLHLRPVKNLDNISSESLDNCSLSVEDYKSVKVKATSILDLLGDTVNIAIRDNNSTENNGATINLQSKSAEDNAYGGHSVDICGSYYNPNDSKGSINIWGDGYLNNGKHYGTGPSGIIMLSDDPDVSITKEGKLVANKSLAVKNGADISSGLNVSDGAKISDFMEISSNSSPRIDFKHSSSNVTACIKEDPEQTIKISKNLQVEENTIVKDLEIHPTGTAPIYINNLSSGPIIDVIKKNWKGGGTGLVEATLTETAQRKNGTLNLMKFYSSYIDAINSTIKVVVDPMVARINFGSYFKTEGGSIIYKVYFNNIKLKLDLYTPSKGYISLYESSSGSTEWNKEDINPSDGWMNVDAQYNLFSIPRIEKEIEGIKIGEKIQIYLSITMNNPTYTYTGPLNKTYEDSSRRYIEISELPTVKITQSRISGYSDPKAVMSGNLIMLGVNKHRTIGLYVDSRSDKEFTINQDNINNKKDINDTCGIFFTYTGGPADNKKTYIKVLSIRTLYNKIFGDRDDFDLSDLTEGGPIEEDAIVSDISSLDTTTTIKNIVDTNNNYEEISKM